MKLRIVSEGESKISVVIIWPIRIDLLPALLTLDYAPCQGLGTKSDFVVVMLVYVCACLFVWFFLINLFTRNSIAGRYKAEMKLMVGKKKKLYNLKAQARGKIGGYSKKVILAFPYEVPVIESDTWTRNRAVPLHSNNYAEIAYLLLLW